MEKNASVELAFTEVIPNAVEAWERFHFHARCVRYLSRAHDYNEGVKISPDVFRDLGRHLPLSQSSSLLPTLKRMVWIALTDQDLNPITLFAPSSSLVNLEIVLEEGVTAPATSTILHTLASHPEAQLRSLKFSTPFEPIEIQTSLSYLVQQQQNLESIAFPTRFLVIVSGELVEALACLPHLHTIDVIYGGRNPYIGPTITEPILFVGEGRSQALRELTLAIFIPEAIKIFQINGATNLVVVQLDLLDANTTEHNIYELTKAFAIFCPSVERINFEFPSTENQDGVRYLPMSWRFLRPLLRCGKLSSLKLMHRESIECTDDDVRAMAQAWPGLATLEPSPAEYNLTPYGTLTPVSLLTIFANEMPHLRTLSLGL